jgi:hypothetical protein
MVSRRMRRQWIKRPGAVKRGGHLKNDLCRCVIAADLLEAARGRSPNLYSPPCPNISAARRD